MIAEQVSVAPSPVRIRHRSLHVLAGMFFNAHLPVLKCLHIVWDPQSLQSERYRREILTGFGIRNRFIGYRVALREHGVTHDLSQLLNL